jgi:hypothetical protein
MNERAKFIPALICALTLFCVSTSAQTPERRPAGGAPQPQEQTPGAAAPDAVVSEIALLRRSLQGLSARLREIGERLSAPGGQPGEQLKGPQSSISQNLQLLTSVEQRAEVMRKQLIELIEKETVFRNRLTQIDEEMRPESIDRSLALVGTTRTTDLRDVRRRVLETERRGVESLLNQTAQPRARLEDEVRQADALVLRLRQRLLPLIEKEIDKIIPD